MSIHPDTVSLSRMGKSSTRAHRNASGIRRILEIVDEARKLAMEYHTLTGRPLGISGEVGERDHASMRVRLKLSVLMVAGFVLALATGCASASFSGRGSLWAGRLRVNAPDALSSEVPRPVCHTT
jgi:hypothetical protein